MCSCNSAQSKVTYDKLIVPTETVYSAHSMTVYSAHSLTGYSAHSKFLKFILQLVTYCISQFIIRLIDGACVASQPATRTLKI